MKQNSYKFLFLGLIILSLLNLPGCTTIQTWSQDFFGSRGDLKPTALIPLQIVLAIIMLISLISLIIPIIPGITFIWLSALIYGLVTGFNTTSGIFMGIISALMLLGNVVDNLLMGAGARKGGAPWITTFATVGAAILGSFAFPPFGGIIAAIIVMFTLEIMRLKDSESAFKSTKELIKGFGCSFVVRFLIGLSMITLWIFWLIQTSQWVF